MRWTPLLAASLAFGSLRGTVHRQPVRRVRPLLAASLAFGSLRGTVHRRPVRRVRPLLAIALWWLHGCATSHPARFDNSTGTPVIVAPEEREVAGAKQTAPPPREGDVPTRDGERAPAVASDASWTITVIRLEHANAEQLAETLSGILPPEMTVVPDRPTNSLLISAPSHALEPTAPE